MQRSEPEQAFPVSWSLSFPQISITISQGTIKSAKVNVRMFVFRKCLIDERKTILLNQFTLYIFLLFNIEKLYSSKRLIPNIPLSRVPFGNLIHLSESFHKHSLSYATVESLIHSSKLIHSKHSSLTCITGKLDSFE